MLSELNSEQLAEWEAYNELEPVGDWLTDYRLGYLLSMIANMTVRKKGEPAFLPQDFELIWDEKEREYKVKRQTIEQQKAILKSLSKMKFPKIKSRTEWNKKKGIQKK